MSISERWRKWQADFKHRKMKVGKPNPHLLQIVEGGALVGRFLAGAHGVGLAVSLSAISSTYTSLASVDTDHICLASQFVSRTMREEHTAAIQFFCGGFLALVAATFPRVAWYWRSVQQYDLREEDTPPLSFQKWVSELSATHLFCLSGLFEFLPLGSSFYLFSLGLDHATNLRASPETIQSMWQGFKVVCSH